MSTIRYIAYLRQDGGCDYTIGCGIRILELSALTMEAAREELRKIITEEYTDERELTDATIYEISATWNAPLAVWYEDVIKREQAAARAAQVAEWERLGKTLGLR